MAKDNHSLDSLVDEERVKMLQNHDLDHLVGEERVRVFHDLTVEAAKDPENHEWTNQLIPHLSIHSADPTVSRLVYHFTVLPQHTNKLNSMHGGCTATLFDYCTSGTLILVSRPDFWRFLGVSRTLSVTYLRPIPAGTEVLIESEIISIGKRLAHVRGVIRRAGGKGEVFATCEHDKYNADPDAGKL